MINNKQLKLITESNQYIDSLLDKINNTGYESLKIDEKRYLKKYSEHINNNGDPDEFTYDSEIKDDRYGDKYSGWIDGKEITFKFTEENTIDNETEYYGELTYDNVVYYGFIVTNSNGSVIDYEFHDIYTETGTKNLKMDIGEFEHELYEFFNDEVVKYIR